LRASRRRRRRYPARRRRRAPSGRMVATPSGRPNAARHRGLRAACPPRRPHERLTRTPAPRYSRPPPGVVVSRTSPARTVKDASTRPLGERASTIHGRAGSSLVRTAPFTPGARVRIAVPLTTSVTDNVVWLDTSRSRTCARGMQASRAAKTISARILRVATLPIEPMRWAATAVVSKPTSTHVRPP
jgi:hypothetical protein